MEISLDDRSSSHVNRAEPPEPPPPPPPPPLENTARVQENSQRFAEQLNGSGPVSPTQHNSGIPPHIGNIGDSGQTNQPDTGTQPPVSNGDQDGIPFQGFKFRDPSVGGYIPGTGGAGSGNEQSALAPQPGEPGAAPQPGEPGAAPQPGEPGAAPQTGNKAGLGEVGSGNGPNEFAPKGNEAGAAPGIVRDGEVFSLAPGHGQENERAAPLEPFGPATPPFFGDKPRIAVLDSGFDDGRRPHGERVSDVIEAYTGDRAEIDRISTSGDKERGWDEIRNSPQPYDYINMSYSYSLGAIADPVAKAYNSHSSNQGMTPISSDPSDWSPEQQKQVAQFIMDHGENSQLFSGEKAKIAGVSKNMQGMNDAMNNGTHIFLAAGNDPDRMNALSLMKHFNQDHSGQLTVVGGNQGNIGGAQNPQKYGTSFNVDKTHPSGYSGGVFGYEDGRNAIGANGEVVNGTSFSTPFAIVNDIFSRVGEEVKPLDDLQRVQALQGRYEEPTEGIIPY